MTRVLILTSSTGGGHDMRANALKSWAEKESDLGVNVTIHQALEETHGLYRFGVGVYNWIQRAWPRLHHLYFNFLELAGMHRNAKGLLGKEKFRKVLEAVQPHIVLSTHAHLNHAFFDFARENCGPNLRCVTYCGELHGSYGFSRHWVNPQADLFIGAVSETRQAAISRTMPEERSMVGGFLLRPPFFEADPDPNTRSNFIREGLQLDPAKFILVLGTGANGANNHLAFLEEFSRQRVYPQIVALCGKNEKARVAISSWAEQHPELSVRALPRTEVDQLFRSASLLLARPGTGITSEAILCGCPLVFNCLGGVMPQERITVEFAKAHGFEQSIHRPSQLPPIVDRLIKHTTECEALRLAMQKAAPQGSPREILIRLKELETES